MGEPPLGQFGVEAALNSAARSAADAQPPAAMLPGNALIMDMVTSKFGSDSLASELKDISLRARLSTAEELRALSETAAIARIVNELSTYWHDLQNPDAHCPQASGQHC